MKKAYVLWIEATWTVWIELPREPDVADEKIRYLFQELSATSLRQARKEAVKLSQEFQERISKEVPRRSRDSLMFRYRLMRILDAS